MEESQCHSNTNKKDGYRQLNVRQLGSLRPWDHRGICYMDRKRIQCLSNALQHVHIYLQPFTSYSEILVGNRNFFLALAFNAPVRSGPWDNRGKCHGWKEDSMLIKRLAVYTHLSSTVSQQFKPEV